MTRINIQVPFSEKDEAKRLGARWDGALKVWYVPEGVSSTAFDRWLPGEPKISIRSNSYFIAQTMKACWKCGDHTNVFGIILPAGHETLKADDEPEGNEAWYRHNEPTFVHYVTGLLPDVSSRVKVFSRHYRTDFSKTTQSSYLMNHCEHCAMKQGDFEMYCEPGGAFYPLGVNAASKILLREFVERFGCNGSTIYGDFSFDCMRRI